jgi:membrane protein implicated in regulation of membrane protease activity
VNRRQLANRWLLGRPQITYALEAALLIFLWVLAIVSDKLALFVFAALWTLLILVVRPARRLTSRPRP